MNSKPNLIGPVIIRFTLTICVTLCLSVHGQEKAKKKKSPPPFSWVSPAKGKTDWLPQTLQHGTFLSPSMKVEVGYYIYLPPGYEDSSDRYPVVYHLHGGRPGGEYKSVRLSRYVDAAIRAGTIEPTIYVFPNGGPMSWYNYPQKENGMGEDVFIKETIPHIDRTYRTISGREGRAIEGFSQGGRGTTRIMFKYPELWISTAPGGSGYEPEKRIQKNDGAESEKVVFAPGYNTWDLAIDYSKRENAPSLKPLIWVGTRGFNYEYNLKYMEFLDGLGIPYEKLIVPDAQHSATQIYEAQGDALMKFHQRNFGRKPE